MKCCPNCGFELAPPSASLTPLMKKALDFIRGEVARTGGVPPSYDEIGWHLSVAKSNVHRLVSSLEERGYLLRAKNRPRCIVLVRA